MENLTIHSKYTGSKEFAISNGKTLSITHIGSNKFSLNSKSSAFQNILYILTVCQNLLFVNVFTHANHVSLEFFLDHFLIKDLAIKTVLYKGLNDKGLYSLSLESFHYSYGGYKAFCSTL